MQRRSAGIDLHNNREFSGVEFLSDSYKGNNRCDTLTALSTLSGFSAVTSVILVNSSFTFSRISAQYALPLISRLLINPVNVSAEPNGIEVNCADIETSETASTLVQS